MYFYITTFSPFAFRYITQIAITAGYTKIIRIKQEVDKASAKTASKQTQNKTTMKTITRGNSANAEIIPTEWHSMS